MPVTIIDNFKIITPDQPPVVDGYFIRAVFGVSEQEFIEKLARGDYGNIWKEEHQ